MFKNLKQTISSEQKVRTPQSTLRNDAPNSTPSGHAAITRLPRPSQSMQPRRLSTDKENLNVMNGKTLQSDRNKIMETETLDSPDGVQQVSNASGDFISNPTKSNSESQERSSQNSESAPATEKKVPFFKRLEFLTPLEDQVARGLSESKGSISSLVEVRGNMSAASNGRSDTDVSECTRFDSMSDAEDVSNQHSIDVSAIPKEQLLSKVMRLEKTLLKYREKYSEVASSFREAKHEREKLQSVVQQTRGKSLLQIQELKEQAELDLKAKMHLEEEFRTTLEEKDQLIQVLQTQIAILKDDPVKQSAMEKSLQQSSESRQTSDSHRKIKMLEDQLKYAKDICEGLRSQGDAMQAQLDERLQEIEKLNESNLAEKSKLIKQLREAKNLIEQIEEDKQTAVAEAERQMHKVLEGKDQELIMVHDQVKKLQTHFEQFRIKNEKRENSIMKELQKTVAAGRGAEAGRVDVTANAEELQKDFDNRLNQLEDGFDAERKKYVSEISHLKAEGLRLNETIGNLGKMHTSDIDMQTKTREMALEEQAIKFTSKLEENQMQLAIEERELNKMAAVPQQDAEAQNLLKQLDGELEIVRQKVEMLERTRLEEAQKHLEEIEKFKKKELKRKEEYKTELEIQERGHQEHMSSKAQEFLEKFTSQKKKYEDKLQMRESSWTQKMEEVDQSYSKKLEELTCQNKEKEKDLSFEQQTDKTSELQAEISVLNGDREKLTSRVAELENRYKNTKEQLQNSSAELQGLIEKQHTENERREKDVQAKDAVIDEMKSKMEFLRKKQDILQKSESSNVEFDQNIENLNMQKSELEKNYATVEEKLKQREESIKKHILKMKERQKAEISNLTSQLDAQKQEAIVKIVALEKENQGLQKAQEETHEKFLEAGGRLKALAEKFMSVNAEHEKVLKEKDALLLEEEEKGKWLEERTKELEQSVVQKEQEIELEIEQKMKIEFENRLSNEKDQLENRLIRQKEGMASEYTQEFDKLKATLHANFSEEKLHLAKELGDKFDSEKQKLLIEAEKDFKIRLRNESSTASEKEKAITESYEDVRRKLAKSEEDSSKLQKELSDLNQQFVNLQIEAKQIAENLQTATSENTTLKQQGESFRLKLADLENLCNEKERELDEVRQQLSDFAAVKEKFEGEKKQFEAELSAKNNTIHDLTATEGAIKTDVENLMKELEKRSFKLEESSRRVEDAEKLIEELRSQVSGKSKKFQSSVDARALALEKLNKEWGTKYSELKAKAEQKIAQQQGHLKNAKAELTSQCGLVQKLGEDKAASEKEIQSLITQIRDFENVREDANATAKKLPQMEEKFEEQVKVSENLKAKLEEVEKQLEDATNTSQEARSLIANLRSQLVECENKLKALKASSADASQKLSLSVSEITKLKSELSDLHTLLKASQETLTERDAEITDLSEQARKNDAKIEELERDFDAAKKEEQEKRSSLQLLQGQNDEMVKTLHRLKKEASQTEAAVAEKMAILEEKSKQKIKEVTAQLVGESDERVADFKKKAETKLAQIKSTFASQVEKLKVISQLEEDKKMLEEKLKASVELQERIGEERASDSSKLEAELLKMQEERKKMEESLQEEKKTFETKLYEESEHRIQNILQEEKLKSEETELQVTEVKDHLEQELQVAKFNLEEVEKKMNGEKDLLDATLQEEKDKRVQAESRLAVAAEDFQNKEESWRNKLEEVFARIHELEENLRLKDDELIKMSKDAADQVTVYDSHLDAARKRNEKLEKDREAVKQNLDDAIEDHKRQMQSLRDEVNSAHKQVDVLSKTAVEDEDVMVERKLVILKEDFDRRLKEKEEETVQKIKKLVSEYESQIHQNNENFVENIQKMKHKNLSTEHSLRSNHHKELVFLQREIQSKEKKTEEVVQKYESEIHKMEKNMSEQVDKAMYRAMTAEKKLQEYGHELDNKKLKAQLADINKILAETQQREHESASLTQSLQATVSMATPLANPDKLEYLRRVLYEYIMGNERRTMAKVLISLLQFGELDAQHILEKHGLFVSHSSQK